MNAARQKPVHGKVLLAYHGERAANGSAVVEPIIPLRLVIEPTYGTDPKRGAVLECRAGSAVLGTAVQDGIKTPIRAMTLECGDSTYIVEGIELPSE